jgi:hypothetical protein
MWREMLLYYDKNTASGKQYRAGKAKSQPFVRIAAIFFFNCLFQSACTDKKEKAQTHIFAFEPSYN